jgi:hypothetical protein
MGATNFIWTVAAKSAQEAYKKAVTEAKEMYGSDPYNGTISTTDGFRMFTTGAANEDEAYKFCDDNLDRTEKWGKCGCVENPSKPGEFIFFGWAAC